MQPRLTLAERLYLPQVLGGIAVTTRHFLRNLALHVLHLFGIARDRRASVTTQYPEERKVYSEGYRGAHRLTLKPDGSVDSLKFVAAGRDKVTLNGPKGMAIVGDTLWVADIDAVRGFNRKTGAPIASIPVPGAKFLNDITAGPDGIYITDTGIRFGAGGAVTHPGPDRVFKIAGRKVTTALTFKGQPAPNGITWDSTSSRFVIVPNGDTTIVSWAPGDSAPQPLATAPTMMDGVEALGGGRYLVTSWADSSLHLVADGKVTRIASGIAAPADIGFDRAEGKVAVPQLTENTMELLDVGSVLGQ